MAASEMHVQSLQHMKLGREKGQDNDSNDEVKNEKKDVAQ
jgi:hypothetical protein